MTVDQILDMLRSRVKDLNDSHSYMDPEWHIPECRSKINTLEEIISEIEYRVKDCE